MKSYRDIVGDGGSDVLGQVGERHQAVSQALAGVRHVVAVASGKGGVGKSTLTFVLARALVSSGWRVTVLDADLNGPCQAQMAGLDGAPWLPGESGLVAPRRSDGLGVLSLGSLLAAGEALRFATISRGDEQVWRATRELTLLGDVLAGTQWGELDVLLLDLPPGPERTLQLAQMLGPRAAFLLVSTPSPVAQRVVARSLDALRAASSRVLGYVDNMAGYACPSCGEVGPLFSAADAALPVPCLGAVPFDPALAALLDRGCPAGEGEELAAMTAGRAVATRLMAALAGRATTTAVDASDLHQESVR
jgi:ATP-binding protein involved in chromosome partitioning